MAEDYEVVLNMIAAHAALTSETYHASANCEWRLSPAVEADTSVLRGVAVSFLKVGLEAEKSEGVFYDKLEVVPASATCPPCVRRTRRPWPCFQQMAAHLPPCLVAYSCACVARANTALHRHLITVSCLQSLWRTLDHSSVPAFGAQITLHEDYIASRSWGASGPPVLPLVAIAGKSNRCDLTSATICSGHGDCVTETGQTIGVCRCHAGLWWLREHCEHARRLGCACGAALLAA